MRMNHVLVRSVTALIVLVCRNGVSDAQELNTAKYKSSSARSAISTYNRKVDDARKQFQKDESKARDELIKALEAAQKAETMRSNLEEAVLLKETIDELRKQSVAPKPDDYTALLGTWKVVLTGNILRYQHFEVRENAIYGLRLNNLGDPVSAQGHVVFVDGKATFAFATNPSIVERYTTDGDRLLIEHFYLTDGKIDLNRFPDRMGIGTRIDAAR